MRYSGKCSQEYLNIPEKKLKMMKTKNLASAFQEDLYLSLLYEIKNYVAGSNRVQPQKQILDSADLKQEFNLSDSTIYRWRRDGKIKFIKIGGKYYYSRKSIEALLM